METPRGLRKVAVISGSLLAGAVLGIGAGSALADDRPSGIGPDPNAAEAPTYPVNAHGETYGSVASAARPEHEPDLARAVGDDGQIGYLRRQDLAPPSFTSPEEALAWQRGPGSRPEKIPLFAADGRTVLGTFTINPSMSKERAPSTSP